jgi:hypothetical protein
MNSNDETCDLCENPIFEIDQDGKECSYCPNIVCNHCLAPRREGFTSHCVQCISKTRHLKKLKASNVLNEILEILSNSYPNKNSKREILEANDLENSWKRRK